MTDIFILAVIGSPFGLKGFMKVRSLSGETDHITALKTVTLRQKGIEKQFTVAESLLSDEAGSLLLRLAGIDSPEAAKTLTGAELIGNRSLAVPLKDNEFYVEDLKGTEVIGSNSAGNTEDSPVLGKITDIIEGGGGQLAEILLDSGEKKLVPFRNEFFGNINIEKGRVVLLEPWILKE